MVQSSPLRVLIVGNHPNVLLYASRFQLAKSVELFHVSDSKSSTFQVETVAYGKNKFQLENHFTSVPHLIEAMTQSSEHPSPIFDLIILNASSLQEISSVASQLNPTININTKVFLESSGFVQLEPFVKMSMDLPNLNIFSIATDIDFRKVGINDYKQFSSGLNDSKKNTIYLGESSLSKVKQPQQNQQQSNSKSSAANSSSSLNQQSTKYPKNIVALLDTFQRLFKKLFPQDEISLCNYSSLEFISQQWALAIPKICFDPLLILLEETNPSRLQDEILAKPLISGLVTEIITVLKSMGARLNGNLESESSLLSHWEKMYPNPEDIPSLVYHFIHRTAPLNIDMLLLQPILLADDYSIKTPYLEFLYSLMCQYEKLNEGKSKWFLRREDLQDLRSKINSTSEEKAQLESQMANLQKVSNDKDLLMKQIQDNEQLAQKKILFLQNQVSSLKQEISMVTKKCEFQEQRLRQDDLQSVNVSNGVLKQNHHIQNKDFSLEGQDYAPTGTPNLKDIEDFALIGVNYGEANHKEDSQKQHLQQPAIPLSFNSSQSSGSGSGSVNGSGGIESDAWLKERELEIRKRELDLQERELELERRRAQQQQQQQPPHLRFNKSKKHSATSPTISTRKGSFPQLQQAVPNGRSGKAIHGAIPGQTTSAANFMDPLGPPLQMKGGSGVQNQPPHFHQTSSHSIKPTSRKNRNSNMPLIGNASSLGLNDYGRPPAGGQSRLNSLSTGNLAMQGRIRQSSGTALNNNSNSRVNISNPVKPVYPDSNPLAQDFQSQRQFSSSTTILDGNGVNPNVSTSSVVHSPMVTNGTHVFTDNQAPQKESNPHMTNTNMQTLEQEHQVEPPQITVSEPQPSPALSAATAATAATAASAASAAASTDMNGLENDQKGNKKEKKKKFGLFGKKKKTKK